MLKSILLASTLSCMPFLLAAEKGGASGGGGAKSASGTGTGTGTKTGTKEKPEVTVHAKLAALIEKHDAAAEKAASFMVEIAELVAAENISNAQLIKTIQDTRGIEESSARGQASRIRTLLKDTDQFEALKRGEVTVRAAVKAAQKTRTKTTANKQTDFDNAVKRITEAAKALGQPRATIIATIEAAFDAAKIK